MKLPLRRFVAVSAALAAAAAVLAVETARAQNLFDTPREFAEPGQSLAAGDLDQDGDHDVILFVANQATARPLLNDGSADFALGPPLTLGLGSAFDIDRPVLADLNGDGDLDLAVCSTGAGSAGIQIHHGGPGATFAPAVLVPFPTTPRAIESGDFDADGIEDLAVAYGSDPVTVVWAHFSGGSYVLSPTAQFPSLLVAAALATLDANNDGRADLLASGFSEGIIHLFTTIGGAPIETFQVSLGNLGSTTIWANSGDVDGDGDDDAVLISDESPDLRLRLAAFAGGIPVLGPAQQFPNVLSILTVGASDLRLGDLDGDGDLDLMGQEAISIFGDISASALLLENATGQSFLAPVSVPVTSFGLSAGTADFDGDGSADYCANRTLLFGSGAVKSPFSELVVSGKFTPSSARVVDLDDDGDVDFAPAGSSASNDATGHFGPPVSLLPPPPVPFSYVAQPTLGDFDGDGVTDTIAELWHLTPSPFEPDTFLGARLLRGDGTGRYVDAGAAGPAGVPIGKADSIPVDLDSDGDVDLLSISGLAVNSGTGFFAAPVPVLPLGTPLAAADVDADGDADVLTIEGSSAWLTLRRQTAPGVFAAEPFVGIAAGGGGPRFLDVDGDGDLDIVGSTPPGFLLAPPAMLHVIENAGGAFAAVAALPIGMQRSEAHDAADVDGDGWLDLLTVSTSQLAPGGASVLDNGRLSVFRRIPGPALAYESRRTYVTKDASAFADVDGDGDIDVLGGSLLRGTLRAGPGAGLIRQFGNGKPGTGGAVPIIGAKGPASVTLPGYELRVRRARGGASSFLVIGTAEAATPNLPKLGMTMYVGGTVAIVPVPVSGTPGSTGAGELTIPAAIPPFLVGVSIFHQAWHVDPQALFGLSASNGLEVHFGG